MDVDDFRRTGLYDPEAPDAEDRLALLRLIAGDGTTLEEMQEALAEDRLIGLAVDAVVRPSGHRMTFTEMCAEAGIDVDTGTSLLRAAGFARPERDDRVFTEADVRAFRFLGVIPLTGDPPPAVQITRAAGAAMSSLAETELAAIRSAVEGPLREAGVSEFAQAQWFRAVASVLPEMLQVLDVFHRRHLLAGMRARVFWEAGRPNLEAAVGFADLVEYTTHVQSVGMRDLAAIVDRFETIARSVIADGGGRLVKLIGDEVMFGAPTARDGFGIAAGLLRAFAAESDLPDVRVGLAHGRVLAFEGDYYGRPVNIAARLAKEAEPGTALVTATVRDAIGDDVVLEPAGSRPLKGVGTIQTFRLRAS